MKHKEEHPVRTTGIVRFAIDYPYFIVVACLMVGLLGVLAYNELPKDLLPAANQPAVQILSFYPGMPVDHVAQNLTSRFEIYTGQAIGLERQESKSLSGVSITRNYFNSSTDLNTAIAQTTSLIMSVLRKLPPGTQPPLILPFDPMAAVPLALVSVSGDVPEKVLVDKGRYDVDNAIQAVQGAMAPTVMGGTERQVLVYLDPLKLGRYNFSSIDVLKKMTQLNTFIPTGEVKLGPLDYQILSNGLADTIDEMNEYPLRSENGVTVKLKDVGHATDANKIQTNIVMVDGKRQVYVPVYRQPGANSIRVVDEVKQAMTKLGERLPGITLKVVADQSQFIRHAIESITEETLIGGGLAALMVFFFLGSPRATLAIMLSIPLSLLFAFLGLKAIGQSLNAMTLGGLALSIGVLVDNSIVVLENISRQREAGRSGLQAALIGASEVAMPVLASTLCVLIVLFPIVFLGGISKVLFSALAVAVTLAMVGSYFAAMTVIPLFATRFLAGRVAHVHELWLPLRLAQYGMARLTQFYGHVLNQVLKRKIYLLVVIVALVAVGAMLAPSIGTELFPRADSGGFILKTRLASGTRIEETEKFAKEMNDKLRQWIAPSDLSMIITNAGLLYGFPAAFTPNTGTQDAFFNIELTPDRKHTSQYYAAIVRRKMAKEFPNVDVGIELGGLLTSALNGGLAAPIDIQIEGKDFEKARALADSILPQIKKLKGATDARIQQRNDAPQLYLKVDRAKADELGLSVDGVMKSVVSTVSGSTSFLPAIWVDPKTGIDYLFGVQTPEDRVTEIKDLDHIPLTGAHQDRGVPLKDVATISESKGPSEITHVNLAPVVDIFLDAQGRDIGGLSRDVQKILDKVQWPTGYHGSIRGEVVEMNSAVGSLKGGFLLAAVLVYLILVIQFKSFKIPAIVISTVPIGMVGIIMMLALTHTYFSIQAAIGAIFMIGIAVANGVLLIEFIIHKVDEMPGHSAASLQAAIIDASRQRLRPILMTSLSSMLGLIPMAIGLGHGSEANIPLGRSVIGGQFLSTILTLFLVPVLFQMLSKSKLKAVENAAKDNDRDEGSNAGAAIAMLALTFGTFAAMTMAGSRAQAAEGANVSIPLGQALKRAEQASPALKSAGFHVESAQQGIKAEQSAYLPTLNAAAIGSTGQPGALAMDGIDNNVKSADRVGVGAGLVLKQDIWDFGRTSSSVRTFEARAAVENKRISVLKIDLDQSVLANYVRCSAFRSLMKDSDFIASQVRLIQREVDKFVQSGQRSVIERYLVEAEAKEADTRTAEYSERTRAEGRKLAIQLALHPGDVVACASMDDVAQALGQTKTDASVMNSFLDLQKARVQMAESELDRAKAENMPMIHGIASGGYFSNDDIKDHMVYTAGLGVTLPLFTGFRVQATVDQQTAELNAARADLNNVEQQVSVSNSDFDEQINALKIRLQFLDKERVLAKQTFELARSRYLTLKGTMIDLREALRNLSRVLQETDEANRDLLIAQGARAIFNGAQIE